AARVFAQRVIECGGSDASARLSWAFHRALSRDPRPAEIAVLTTLLNKHLAEYTSDTKAAAEVLKNGEAPTSKGIDSAELAAWTSVTRAILNLHETVNRL